ncbi:sulfide-dependent adenosine diphosphate thiazole synthase [bacterium]|nr:sulfide-dependent adenosine diphosphate thiazole synthase [bacterium]
MKLDEIIITEAIIETFTKKFRDYLSSDVAIAGGGPAGLCAAYYLAKAKKKVVLFERKLSVGGGMWGGGMMFNSIVVCSEGKKILDEFGIRNKEYKKGYYVADAIEAVTTLASKAVKAGAQVFNLMSVEDVEMRKDRVTGFVLNWSSVELANLHVDPMTIRAKFLVEATGHPCEVAKIIQRKLGTRLKTRTGGIVGEEPMWAEVGERAIVKNTKEFYPGAYVAGMAANAVFGGPRMGPIFGGMLLSGKKVAQLIAKRI